MFGRKKKKKQEIKEEIFTEKPRKTKQEIYKELAGVEIEEVKKDNDN
jgi:hypothetical protein